MVTSGPTMLQWFQRWTQTVFPSLLALAVGISNRHATHVQSSFHSPLILLILPPSSLLPPSFLCATLPYPVTLLLPPLLFLLVLRLPYPLSSLLSLAENVSLFLRHMFEMHHASNPVEELVKGAAGGDVGKVEELLKQGICSVDVQFNGHTALQAASQNGHIDVVRCLIRYKANLEEEVRTF